jgi:tripartite-type tricarboxylate transporter receptor subunit TctC
VIRAKPDGYTLFFVNNGNLAVTPSVVKDANYDGVKDFTPIALGSSAAMVAVVPASVPANDLKGFIDYAKANPVAYASAGIGSFGQLATELFANRAGVKMTHVPYKGQAPTTTAAVAGEVQLLITTPSGGDERVHPPEAAQAARRHLAEPSPLAPERRRSARCCRATWPRAGSRSSARPACPPTWSPSSTPRSAPRCSCPEIQQRFTTFGVVAKTTTPQKLSQMVAEEVARWTPVIRDNNIRTD